MVKLIIKYRIWSLSIIITLAIIACFNVSSLNIKTDFFQFLSDDDPEYLFYKKIKKEIKDDESMLLIGIKSESSIYDIEYLKNVNVLIDTLSKIKTIKRISSLTNLKFPIKSSFGIIPISYININDSLKPLSKRKKILSDYTITQNFINKEENSLYIWIELDDNLNAQKTDSTLIKIKHVQTTFPHLDTYLWGKPYLKHALNDMTKEESRKFMFLGLGFLIISLFLVFKNLKAIATSVLLIVISFIVFLGVLVFFNRPFNLLSNLFSTIVLIVGISDLIHMSIKYNQEFNKNKNLVIQQTIKEIGVAIFITSLTTALGFIILSLTNTKALRNFGFEAGSAVMLTFIITLLLAPTFFKSPKNENTFKLTKTYNRLTKLVLVKIEEIQKHSIKIISAFTIVIVIGIIGITQINTNNLQFSLPDKSELKENYTFFENLGTRSFELVFSAKNNHKLNESKILNSLNAVHNHLDNYPTIKAVKSPILFYRQIDKAFKPNLIHHDSLTLPKKTIKKYESYFNTNHSSKYLMNTDKTIFKFKAQMNDLGRKEVSKQNEKILQEIIKLVDTSKVSIKLSGIDLLFDRAHEQRINNMTNGLIIAIIVVGITIGFIFKDLKMTLAALLLNIFPLVFTAGLLGFSNLELRSGSSMIFTISFVIAVDDTIHFLSKFQWEIKQGRTVLEAIHIAIQECGKAILTTSFILAGGFFILMLSDFAEIFTVGFLVGTTIIIALLVDLILAPILLKKLF